MTKDTKTQKTQMSVFVQNSKMKIFLFCVITFKPIITKTYQAPQNGRLNLSFVKDNTIWSEKMAKKGPTEVIYNSVSFRIGL